MNSSLIVLIFYYASMYNIDPSVAMSIAHIESNFKINAVGPVGEIGLYQINPKFSDRNVKDLFRVEVNVELGIKKLAEAKKYCSHQDDNTWVICYNIGVTGAKKVKHPTLFPYYKKFRKAHKVYAMSDLY